MALEKSDIELLEEAGFEKASDLIEKYMNQGYLVFDAMALTLKELRESLGGM